MRGMNHPILLGRDLEDILNPVLDVQFQRKENLVQLQSRARSDQPNTFSDQFKNTSETLG